MIKVMHILTDCNVGGAGRWLLNFLKNADKTNFNIEVILPKGSLLAGFIRRTGVHVEELPFLAEKSLDLKALKPLYSYIKSSKPDIVHAHASLTARIAARLAGIKAIVFTKHCLDNKASVLKKTANRIINSLFCDRIIAISEAVKTSLVENGTPARKVTVIYNGIQPVNKVSEAEKDEFRQKLGINPDDAVVGIVARLEDVKGHRYFLEAASLIKNKMNNVKFIIAGTGSQLANIKMKVKELALVNNVILTGYIDDIEKLFGIFDVNVITSISEALCLSLIEGMSAGLPSVAFETGGIAEVVDEKCGFLVPAGDTEKLAEAIIKLLNNKELRDKMGIEGKRIANTKFSARIMVNKIENLYSELI